jgi:glycosyltransferase involved in cell wall biosynthesis
LQEGWPRLQRTGFARLYRTWLSLTAGSRANRVRSLLRGFEPQAVLTVTYYYSWLTAAKFASQQHLPLHLILHDEYVEAPFVVDGIKPWLHRQFGEIYRKAATRMCISPYMAGEYQQKYGAPGDVLPPSRASDARVFDGLPERLLQSPGKSDLVVAFGGTVGSAGGIRQLALVAQALQPMNGVLKIFGPIDPARARAAGLAAANVVFRGSLDPEAFKQALREEADVLLAPMNFAPEEATNARISFPSKLADYTSVGLPILILGPDYCSAVRWASDNLPVAEVVMHEDLAEITAALQKLCWRERRLALAEAAVRKGDEFFRHATVAEKFRNYLCAHVSQTNIPASALVATEAGGRASSQCRSQ